MKHYIKVDKVMAKPMTVREFYEQTKQSQFREMIENGEGDKEGYYTVDDDGSDTGVPCWVPKDKFEESYQMAETPIDRMVIESKDLMDKINKLSDFINSERYQTLDSLTQAMLTVQLHLMYEYHRSIKSRAELMLKSGIPKSMLKNGTLTTWNDLSFGIAILFLKEGFALRRAGWNGKGLFVIKQVPAHIDSDIIPHMQSLPQSAKNLILKEKGFIDYTSQCLIYNRNTGRADSWVPSISDVFATDWEVVVD